MASAGEDRAAFATFQQAVAISSGLVRTGSHQRMFIPVSISRISHHPGQLVQKLTRDFSRRKTAANKEDHPGRVVPRPSVN